MSFSLVYHFLKWIYGLHMETNSLLEKYLGWLTSLRGSKEFSSPWNPEASGDPSSAVPHLIFQENSLPSHLAFHFIWVAAFPILSPFINTTHFLQNQGRNEKPFCSYIHLFLFLSYVIVQLPSRAQLFVTPWTSACQASLSFTISRVCSISCPLSWWTIQPSHSVIPFSSCLQSFPESKSFPMLALRIRRPTYWNFSFIISPSNENSGFIYFRIEWFDLLAAQRTLKSLFQH